MGAGPKAFCAGGDVATLADRITSDPDGMAYAKAYFRLEYQLDHLIATYSKPYVAYMDGITMGGGAGLSVHAPFRIATERTLFAMPETTIGFFPDVGASFFLPRLEGFIGTYLGLTSERLQGVNVFYAGIATHYIDSSMLPSLTARLSELEFKDYDSQEARYSIIQDTIEEFGTGLPYNEPMVIVGDLRQAIDRCFQYNEVEQIIEALEKEKGGPMGEWANTTLQTLSARSPTSLKVTLRLMRIGKGWNISDAFQREYHIASRFVSHPDFASGVLARLIHKPPTKAEWNPAKLEDVKSTDVDKFFIVEGQERLQLVGEEARWRNYPAQLGLPREGEVQSAVEEVRRAGGSKRSRRRSSSAFKAMERTRDIGERGMSEKEVAEREMRESVVEVMVKKAGGKLGVRERVEEVLQRMCTVGDDGLLVWGKEEAEKENGEEIKA